MKNLLLFSLFLFLPAFASAASFDCMKASTSVEKMICGDIELSGLDSAMATSYKKVRASSPHPGTIVEQQKIWLQQRNQCASLDCLRSSYTQRLSELGLATSNAPAKAPAPENSAAGSATQKWVGRYYGGSEKLNSHDPDDSMLVKKGAGDDDMSIDEEDILLKIPAGSAEEKKIQTACVESELCEIVGKVEGKRLVSLVEVRHLPQK